MLDTDLELPPEFLLESQERVERIESLLLEIESSPREMAPATAAALLRDFHTLKVNCGAMGFANLVEVCLAAEQLLKGAELLERTGVRSVCAGLLAASAKVSEVLDLGANGKDVDLTAAAENIAHLHGVTASDSLASASVDSPRSAPTRPEHEREQSSHALSATHTQLHVDEQVYRFGVIRSLSAKFDEEDAWLFWRASELASSIARGQRWLPQLLDMCRGHSVLRRCDRLCLVRVVANSNMLCVIDSCCTDRVGENRIRPGYSCFVNPEGSLFQLQPGKVRVFGETNRVLDAFRKRGMPVQRSISLISAMGFRSGLCLAFGQGDRPEGFLFANSLETDAFSQLPRRYAPLLSLLTMCCIATLRSVEDGDSRLIDRTCVFRAEQFESSRFEQTLSRYLHERQGRQVQVRIVQSPSTSFLYLREPVAAVIGSTWSRLTSNVSNSAKCASLTVHFEQERVIFSLPHGRLSEGACPWHASQLAQCVRAARCFNVDLIEGADSLHFSLRLERSPGGSAWVNPYSVEEPALS